MQTLVPGLHCLFFWFCRVEVVVAITDSPSLSADFHLVVLPLPRQDG